MRPMRLSTGRAIGRDLWGAAELPPPGRTGTTNANQSRGRRSTERPAASEV